MQHAQTPTSFKPLILVAAFLVGVTAMIEVRTMHLDPMRAMDNFMAGFFLFFSFFKFLNLKGFATAFSTYDIVAKRVKAYGSLYPFLELGLGVMFALQIATRAANIATIILMVVGSLGVIDVLKRRGKIPCACLGTIFNLPMTKITLFENGLMLVMAVASLALHA